MARIAIVTQLHPCTNPRPVKEANTLAAEGHEVFFVTILQSDSMADADLDVLDERVHLLPAVDLRSGRLPKWKSLWIRGRRRLGSRLVSRFGLETISAVCHSPESLLKKCAELNCDLYIGHIEGGLWACRELKKKGFRVAFDLEDWHSRDGLPDAQRAFPTKTVSELESFALNHGAYASTTSVPLAESLEEAYGGKRPAVLRNVFPLSDMDAARNGKADREDLETPSLTWFSQTIGPGRGLEELWQALEILRTPVQIHLRGNPRPDFAEYLKHSIPSPHRLYLHPLIPHRELLPRISEHDVGLALEKNEPPSRDLTLTNKIFQYLQAGCAVIATKTAGQMHLADQYRDVIDATEIEPQALAAAIENLISDRDLLCRRKQQAQTLAMSELNWDQESRMFVALVQEALNS